MTAPTKDAKATAEKTGEIAAGTVPNGTAKRSPLVRPTVWAAGGLVLILCGLTVLALRWSRSVSERTAGLAPGTLGTPSAPVAAPGRTRPVQPEVDSQIFQVTEATGRVEAQRGGKWVLISSGDVLTQDDVVRTGIGRAILRRGTAEIELRDRVEIRLDSISRAGASLDLRRGRVVANVGLAGGSVAITAARTRTANQGDAPARFVVTADGKGRVSVATTAGAALFESAGRTVKVAAGNATRAEPDQPPSDPERISEDIFLNVTWPAGERREDKVPVTGRTDPGAIVRVNGTPAELDRAGHFAASVPVRVGSNDIEVEVEDVGGRTRKEKASVRKIPTRPPELAPVPAELWQQ